MDLINNEWKEKFFKHYFQENISPEELRNCLAYKNSHLDKPLYQYTKVSHVEDIICDDLMYLRKISELNDPFEGDLLSTVEKYEVTDGRLVKLELDWEAVKEQVSIACFSERFNINPMWAHYGDNHKGVCVGYDFNTNMIIKELCFPVYYVNYTDNNVVSEKLFENFKAETRLLSEIFLKKGQDWHYEREWRILVPSNLSVVNGINFKWKDRKRYLKFLKPESVYLGYNINDDDKKYLKAMCKDYGIKTYEMVKDESGYNLKAKEV